ncbi:MAG TPA: DUF4870 domain-containing protein [Ornithinibacter sp.]|nr:DUF4870 domain-containing protein [Ornithinibacter sp.]
MSDTTPRPDETPADPTAPPPAPTPEEVAAPAEPVSADAPPPPPVPYPVPPATNAADPAFGQFYAQQGYAAPPPGQQPPPQPYGAPPGQQLVPTPMSPSEERTWGMAAHGIALGATVLSAGFLSFVAALVTYIVVRDRGPFVRHHAANALNVQIIAGIVMLVSLPLMIVLIGFVSFAAAWLFAVVVHIVGAVKANNGEWYNPPLTPLFVK